jgi:hypothetical protein
VRPPGVEKTSRFGSTDPVADEVKCGPHGGKNSGTKSWMVSWLSLKTKVEPGRHGSRVMSGDWRRLHRVRGVCSGSPENHWVTWLIYKIDEEVRPPRPVQPPKTGSQTAWASLTAHLTAQRGGRSDRPGHCRREASKRRTRIGIARLASSLSKVAVAGHPSDGENLKTCKLSLEGHVSLII